MVYTPEEAALLEQIGSHYTALNGADGEYSVQGTLGCYYGNTLRDALEQYRDALLSLGTIEGGTEKSKKENTVNRNVP